MAKQGPHVIQLTRKRRNRIGRKLERQTETDVGKEVNRIKGREINIEKEKKCKEKKKEK
jgi:hypothetical protein